MPSSTTTVDTRPTPLHGQHYATGHPWAIEWGVAEEATLRPATQPTVTSDDPDATPLATTLPHLQIDRLDRVAVPLPRYYSPRCMVDTMQTFVREHRPLAIYLHDDCTGPDRTWGHGTVHALIGPQHDATYLADCLAAAVAGCSLPRWRGWLRAIRRWLADRLQPR
jgi:hypothetical protein